MGFPMPLIAFSSVCLRWGGPRNSAPRVRLGNTDVVGPGVGDPVGSVLSASLPARGRARTRRWQPFMVVPVKPMGDVAGQCQTRLYPRNRRNVFCLSQRSPALSWYFSKTAESQPSRPPRNGTRDDPRIMSLCCWLVLYAEPARRTAGESCRKPA